MATTKRRQPRKVIKSEQQQLESQQSNQAKPDEQQPFKPQRLPDPNTLTISDLETSIIALKSAKMSMALELNQRIAAISEEITRYQDILRKKENERSRSIEAIRESIESLKNSEDEEDIVKFNELVKLFTPPPVIEETQS